MLDPKRETLAFRIWQYCKPIGWNATAIEIGNAIGASYQSVSGVLVAKGWANRVRTTRTDKFGSNPMGHSAGFDEYTLNYR